MFESTTLKNYFDIFIEDDSVFFKADFERLFWKEHPSLQLTFRSPETHLISSDTNILHFHLIRLFEIDQFWTTSIYHSGNFITKKKRKDEFLRIYDEFVFLPMKRRYTLLKETNKTAPTTIYPNFTTSQYYELLENIDFESNQDEESIVLFDKVKWFFLISFMYEDEWKVIDLIIAEKSGDTHKADSIKKFRFVLHQYIGSTQIKEVSETYIKKIYKQRTRVSEQKLTEKELKKEMFKKSCIKFSNKLKKEIILKSNTEVIPTEEKSFSFEVDKIKIHFKEYKDGIIHKLHKDDKKRIKPKKDSKDEDKYLNDEIINSTSKMFQLDFPETNALVFGTYFYTLIHQKQRIDAFKVFCNELKLPKESKVEKIQDAIEIFEKYEFVLIPVNIT